VSNVSNMISMFYGAKKFKRNIAGWDVRNVTNMMCMFNRANGLLEELAKLNVKSFFEGEHRHMFPRQRHRAFDILFAWERRKHYMVFLAQSGYLYCECARQNYERESAKPKSEELPSDSVFRVEDFVKYICSFL